MHPSHYNNPQSHQHQLMQNGHNRNRSSSNNRSNSGLGFTNEMMQGGISGSMVAVPSSGVDQIGAQAQRLNGRNSINVAI